MNKVSQSGDGPCMFLVGQNSALTVLQADDRLRVISDDVTVLELRLEREVDHLHVLYASDDQRLTTRAMSASAEVILAWRPSLDRLVLDVAGQDSMARDLITNGVAIIAKDRLVLVPEMVMQRRDNWLVDPERPPLPPPCHDGRKMESAPRSKANRKDYTAVSFQGFRKEGRLASAQRDREYKCRFRGNRNRFSRQIRRRKLSLDLRCSRPGNRIRQGNAPRISRIDPPLRSRRRAGSPLQVRHQPRIPAANSSSGIR